MQKHIARFHKNLHAKPAHEKRRFSLQVSGVITALIFMVWLSTLGFRLAHGNLVAPSQDSQTLVAAVADAQSGIGAQFSQMQNSFQSLSSLGGTSAQTNMPVDQSAATDNTQAAAPAQSLDGSVSSDTASSSDANAYYSGNGLDTQYGQ